MKVLTSRSGRLKTSEAYFTIYLRNIVHLYFIVAITSYSVHAVLDKGTALNYLSRILDRYIVYPLDWFVVCS